MDTSTNALNSQLLAAANAAPEYVRNFIGSGAIDRMSQVLTERGKLSENILTRIENETLFAVLGITNPDEFEENLKTAANVPVEELPEVLAVVTGEVFGPLALLGDAKINDDANPIAIRPKSPEFNVDQFL